MRGFLHRISHFFGWNAGTIVTFWLEDYLWVGFKCHECGEVLAHQTRTKKART